MTTAAADDTTRDRRLTLGACGGTHVLHDGLSSLLYVFLPVWQAEFGLSLAQVGLLKGAYSVAVAICQMPAGLVAERYGARGVLVFGTAVAGIGFLAFGLAGGALALAACLVIAGIGASVQHPLCSALVAQAYEDGGGRRAALGIYNFSGDLGKLAAPALAAVLIAALGWRGATTSFGVIALVVAAILFVVLGRFVAAARRATAAERGATGGWAFRDRNGFALLSLIAIFDNACTSGFLTFLPFLLTGKGASLETIGLALTLVFAGGATGKFLCGVLAERIGLIRTVVLTELVTGGGILVLLTLPLEQALMLLPLIGVGLSGTSSVLYGTVAELVAPEGRSRAFALFYTVGFATAAVAPWIYGAISDRHGVPTALVVVAIVALAVIPLAQLLRPSLGEGVAPSRD